jgi:hypothetical protein
MQNNLIKAMFVDGRSVRTQCDLVVHGRTHPDNLIAIEMKKSMVRRWRRDRDRRRWKLSQAVPAFR